MRKHEIVAFEGALKATVHEGTVVGGDMKSETGLMRKTRPPSLAGSANVLERMQVFLNEGERKKQDFFAQVCDPTPSPDRPGEHIVLVHCFWEEPTPTLPVAPSAMPSQASSAPQVKM
ncbi:MAG: hypothetical protein Q8L24_00720 [bacterium]|nr:hypothetical protein [bacterium]